VPTTLPMPQWFAVFNQENNSQGVSTSFLLTQNN